MTLPRRAFIAVVGGFAVGVSAVTAQAKRKPPPLKPTGIYSNTYSTTY